MAALPDPIPLIDAHQYMAEHAPHQTPWQAGDYAAALNFLTLYTGNQATFDAYRREVERLLQWAWLVEEHSILELSREQIEAYIQFCLAPPVRWIGLKRTPRFLTDKDGIRSPNPAWRPFVAQVTKQAHQAGKAPTPADYQLSQSSRRALFAVLGSFYDYLLLEEKVTRNPIALIRQKSRYLQKAPQQKQIIRLSDSQWGTCLQLATDLADEAPEQHERTLFILTAMYLMYLRISELTATERWTPQMNHFYRDSEGQWWFKTLGKGNKMRIIAVSDTMLAALSRYRKSLGETPLPSPADHAPLIRQSKSNAPITSTRHIRRLIQGCFDRAVDQLRAQGLAEEADALGTATAHWLRHTGISDDVNKRGRPMLHVRDDAGHASMTTTEGYSDVEIRDRHRSAKDKTLDIQSE